MTPCRTPAVAVRGSEPSPRTSASARPCRCADVSVASRRSASTSGESRRASGNGATTTRMRQRRSTGPAVPPRAWPGVSHAQRSLPPGEGADRLAATFRLVRAAGRAPCSQRGGEVLAWATWDQPQGHHRRLQVLPATPPLPPGVPWHVDVQAEWASASSEGSPETFSALAVYALLALCQEARVGIANATSSEESE